MVWFSLSTNEYDKNKSKRWATRHGPSNHFQKLDASASTFIPFNICLLDPIAYASWSNCNNGNSKQNIKWKKKSEKKTFGSIEFAEFQATCRTSEIIYKAVDASTTLPTFQRMPYLFAWVCCIFSVVAVFVLVCECVWMLKKGKRFVCCWFACEKQRENRNPNNF